MPDNLPRVVIIGGGFGGLSAARKLARAAVRVTLVDRRNHHLFQPLLYQVAMAGLSPSDIASPIRRILRYQKNAEVILAEARSIDLAARTVALDEGSLQYDYLVVATGGGMPTSGTTTGCRLPRGSRASRMRWKFAAACSRPLSWPSATTAPSDNRPG